MNLELPSTFVLPNRNINAKTRGKMIITLSRRGRRNFNSYHSFPAVQGRATNQTAQGIDVPWSV